MGNKTERACFLSGLPYAPSPQVPNRPKRLLPRVQIPVAKHPQVLPHFPKENNNRRRLSRRQPLLLHNSPNPKIRPTTPLLNFHCLPSQWFTETIFTFESLFVYWSAAQSFHVVALFEGVSWGGGEFAEGAFGFAYFLDLGVCWWEAWGYEVSTQMAQN